MKIFILLFVIITISKSPLFSQYPIIADHRAVNEFNSIPDSYLPEAAKIRIMFRHASVGTTFNNGLECLQGTRNNPKECNDYPDYKYDRRNWVCQIRSNSGWYGKVDDFIYEVQNQLQNFDIFSFKYCYLDGLDQIAEPCGSPMDAEKVQKAWDYLCSKMEMLEATYPEKQFIWWTIPLTQIGQKCTDSLNKRIRQYCLANGKFLFDIADIQCHDENGNPVATQNGLEKAYKPFCGEQQEDAQACHPNWTGSIRISKAFWWLIARIAGWEGITGSNDENLNLSQLNPLNIEKICPNPVSGNTEIHFKLLHPSEVSLKLYDLYGLNIFSAINNKPYKAGSHRQQLDCTNLTAGLYYLELSSDAGKAVKAIVKY